MSKRKNATTSKRNNPPRPVEECYVRKYDTVHEPCRDDNKRLTRTFPSATQARRHCGQLMDSGKTIRTNF